MDADGTIYYRRFLDVVLDLLMDTKLKDAMEYHAKPLYIDGRRVFGPFTSSTLWEAQEHMHPDQTVVHCWLYHDETEFQKHSTALPFMGKKIVYCMLSVYVLNVCVVFCSYTGKHQ